MSTFFWYILLSALERARRMLMGIRYPMCKFCFSTTGKHADDCPLKQRKPSISLILTVGAISLVVIKLA